MNVRREKLSKEEIKTVRKKRNFALLALHIVAFFFILLFIFFEKAGHRLSLLYKIFAFLMYIVILILTIAQFIDIEYKEVITGRISQKYTACGDESDMEYYVVLENSKKIELKREVWDLLDKEDMIVIHTANKEIISVEKT